MARPTSERVKTAGDALRTRLNAGEWPPGSRFLSARDVAAQYEISYQTAHRLLSDLAAQNQIERRAASGSFIPGKILVPATIQLCFHERAQRPESFGARLLSLLRRRCEVAGLPYEQVESLCTWTPDAECFPVFWEASEPMAACVAAGQRGLLLNDRPLPGLAATLLDSIAVEDFSGGASAAQLLRERTDGPLAVLAGPINDRRSSARRDGFLTAAPDAVVVQADGWYFENGRAAAPDVLRAQPAGVFCANDRLAAGLLAGYREAGENLPAAVVGFDDAPIAARLHLTTIAIPWDEMIESAGQILRQRLSGDAAVARQVLLHPRWVRR